MKYLLVGLALAGAAAFAIVTPIGEAPDEPAHIAYAQHIASDGSLPPVAAAFDRVNYESHQPPLGYLVQALVLRLVAPQGIRLEYRPDPSFGFDRSGSRAFLHPVGDASARRAVIAMRLSQIGWLLVTVLVSMRVASQLAPESHPVAAAYLLAPQLLFVSGVVNNDAALIALVSVTIFLLIRLTEEPSVPRAVTAGIALAAALFAKGAALFLGMPIAVAAIILLRRRVWKPALGLLLTSMGGIAVWLAMNWLRFGTLMPPVPTAGVAGSVTDLVTRPQWVVSLFVSFWAKFGWLNTPMPAVAYIWFAALAVLAIMGAIRQRSAAGVLAVSAITANLVFIALFLVMVDWQPQGRYLLPSIAPIAALGAASGIPRRYATWVAAASAGVLVAAIVTAT